MSTLIYALFFFLNLSINPQLIISSVFLVTFCFGRLKVVLTPTHPSLLPWPAMVSHVQVTRERKADAPISCCLSLAPSVSDCSSLCLCGRSRPTAATQTLCPHPLVSVCLSVLCLFTVSVSVYLPVFHACWSPSQGPPNLGTECAFSGPVLGPGERSALKIQLGLFTKPHCSYA